MNILFPGNCKINKPSFRCKNKKFLVFTPSVFVLITLLIIGCNNNIEEVRRLNSHDTIPTMYAKDVSIAQSESGFLKYNLTAPVLYRYETKKGVEVIFPEGFKVVFYDSINPNKIRTEITANYGINKETKKIMEAKSNVVVINHLKGEQLNTEHLIWDQNTKKVFSDLFVKITTPDKILYGDGMQSDETFNHWRIRKPRGEMYVNENK